MSQTKFRVFQRVGKTKIIPIGLKILLIFICLILLSNFATNIITIQLSQNQIIKLNNQVMVEQLKELYNSSSNQYQIYTYSNNIEECETSLKQVAKSGFTNPNSIALAVKKDGTIDFYVSNNELSVWDEFIDSTTLQKITSDTVNGIYEGSISFKTAEEEYFGVYKFQDDWDYFLIRAENRSDLDDNNKSLYLFMFIFVIALTTVFVIIGILVIRHEFKSVRTITNDLYNMQKNKKLELIDLSNSTNDDITYLAASFNSLSSSVNNLLMVSYPTKCRSNI